MATNATYAHSPIDTDARLVVVQCVLWSWPIASQFIVQCRRCWCWCRCQCRTKLLRYVIHTLLTQLHAFDSMSLRASSRVIDRHKSTVNLAQSFHAVLHCLSNIVRMLQGCLFVQQNIDLDPYTFAGVICIDWLLGACQKCSLENSCGRTYLVPINNRAESPSKEN